MAKKLTFGNLIKTTGKDGETRLSLALGNKSKNERYNLTVEVVVRDNTGKVVAKQTDGFIDLVDPRAEPDRLLAKAIISEELHGKLKESASKISEKVRYQARINTL